MKSLKESLFGDLKQLDEGIFGDNVKSDIKINGVTIYEPDWKLCEEYYKKRRKKYFWNKTSVSLGDMLADHEVIYSGDDCVICLNKEETDYNEVYVLCPETIYMNHEAVEITYGRNNAFSLTNVDDANDYNIGFVYYGDTKRWGWLEGCHSAATRKTALEELGINRAYLPETISNKAKSIIKKYM